MDHRLPIWTLMLILWSAYFSSAQAPGWCQCHELVKSVKFSQIVNYSILQPTVNCEALEIRVWLKNEKIFCLDPNERLAKILLACTRRYRNYLNREQQCLCTLRNRKNTSCSQVSTRKGTHIILRSLDK